MRLLNHFGIVWHTYCITFFLVTSAENAGLFYMFTFIIETINNVSVFLIHVTTTVVQNNVV